MNTTTDKLHIIRECTMVEIRQLEIEIAILQGALGARKSSLQSIDSIIKECVE